MTILHGDMRFYNNIFVQQEVPEFLRKAAEHMRGGVWDDGNVDVGIGPYDDYMTEDEWKAEFEGYCGMGSTPSDRYYIPLPVWAAGNVYFNGAKPWLKETGARIDDEHRIDFHVGEVEDGWTLVTNLLERIPDCAERVIDTSLLGMAFEPEERFENPDGTPISFPNDYRACFKGWRVDRLDQQDG